MAVDPVCHMDVEPDKAAASSEYEGQSYYFCNKLCKEKFDQDPDKYLKGPAPEKAGFFSRMFKG
jgi:P-type Cu+ transporter